MSGNDSWRPLQADLVGPFLPEEEADAAQETLPIAPSRWYLTGFLAPKLGRKPDPDDLESTDEGLGGGEQSQAEDAGTDEAEQKRPVRYPASMGLSVFLPPGAGDNIAVRVWYADYDKVEVPIEHTDRKHSGWKRVPQGPVLVTVPLDAVKLKKNGKFPVPESRGLVIQGELRETNMKGLEPGTRVLSLFLVNERTVIERDKGDNFFADLDREKAGRRYVGLGAPGRALRAISVRSYATLLAAAHKHFDKRGEPKQPADPYMTLVGYFNSLRELGGMRRLVEDEVRNRVANITDTATGRVPLLRVGPHPWAEDRKLKLPLELTSPT